MSQKVDFGSLFPSYAAGHARMVRESPMFMRCPGGHDLPHRRTWGRCSPIDCCDFGQIGTGEQGRATKGNPQPMQVSRATENSRPYRGEMALLPLGMEGQAITRDTSMTVDEAEWSEAYAMVRKEMMIDYGARMAREAIHPMPELPKPPDLRELGPREYVRQRMEQVAPYMLEAEIFEALNGRGDKRHEARQALLDRQGYTRKGDGAANTSHGPVFQVNVQINPYEKQKEKSHVEAHSPSQVRVTLSPEALAGFRDSRSAADGEGGGHGPGADAAGVGGAADGEG